MTQLYSVPVTGGRVSMVLPTPALDATVTPPGATRSCTTTQGVRERLAKASHVGRHARHLGLRHQGRRSTRRLSAFTGEDRNPVFDANGQRLLLPERSRAARSTSTRAALGNPAAIDRAHAFHEEPRPVPDARRQPARCASRTTASSTRWRRADEPKKVAIQIAADGRNTIEKSCPSTTASPRQRSRRTGRSSPTCSAERSSSAASTAASTKRITEHAVAGAKRPASAPTAVAGVRGRTGQQLERLRDDDRPRKKSRTFRLDGDEGRAVVATAAEEYQPTFSPDGKEIAYLENRVR